MKNEAQPEWFSQAINTRYQDCWIEVEGCLIHYQLWSRDRNHLPGLVFIHGHGANAHWWDFIAPALMDNYRVAALDVSGAGDSGHRSAYSTDMFVSEIMAVVDDAGFANDCTLVGHSFGGRMARFAGHYYPQNFTSIVLVDSAISLPGMQSNFRIPPPSNRPTRLYQTRQDAARRFRLRPPQPCLNKFIVDYIAMHSVKEIAGGWCWKLDQSVFAKMADLSDSGLNTGDMIKAIRCPVGIIYGEQSRFFTDEVKSYLHTLFDPAVMIPVSDAHHHLFLDQPHAFIREINNLLSLLRSRKVPAELPD